MTTGHVEIAVLDAVGRIVSVNQAWNDFCTANGGDPRTCGPGTSYLAVCDAAGDRMSSRLAAAVRSILGGEQVGTVTVTIPCNGTDGERWFDVSVFPAFGEAGRVVGATVAIWRVERPLRLLGAVPLATLVPDEEGVWDLIEAFPDGTVLVDGVGLITHANRELEHLSGYHRSQLLGQPVEMLVPDAARPRHGAWTRGYAAAPRVRPMAAGVELHLRRADGHELPVEISLAPVRLASRAMTMASVRDVSAQRADTRARRRHNDQAALVARITTMVLSDVEPEVVHDEVVSGTRLLLGRPPWDDTHEHPYTDDELEVLDVLHGQVDLVMHLGAARSDRERLELLEDRQRIARDLHDTVIQALIGIGLQRGTDDALVGQLDAVISHLRLVVFDTRDTGPDDGLGDTVRNVLAVAAHTLGHEPSLVVTGDVDRIAAEVGNHLVPVLREALSNVARHARATGTIVRLTVGADAVELQVDDDGVGPGTAPSGGGTRNFRERAAMLGGTSTWGAGPDGGTRLRWRAPVTFGPRSRDRPTVSATAADS